MRYNVRHYTTVKFIHSAKQELLPFIIITIIIICIENRTTRDLFRHPKQFRATFTVQGHMGGARLLHLLKQMEKLLQNSLLAAP